MTQGKPTFTLADRVMWMTKDPELRDNFSNGTQLRAIVRQNRQKIIKRQAEIAGQMKMASRFYLDDDFVRQVVRKTRETPEKMLEMAQLAFAPSEVVWIEYSPAARWHANKENGTLINSPDVCPHSVVSRQGYLVIRADGDPDTWVASLFADGDDASDDKAASIVPVGVVKGKRVVDAMLGEDHSPQRLTSAAVAWGYIQENVDKKTMLEMTHQGAWMIEPMIWGVLHESGRLSPEWWSELTAICGSEYMGTLRFLITALAMINSVPTHRVLTPAGQSYSKRLKTHKLLDYRTVVIKATPERIVKVVDRSLRQAAFHKRNHPVRMHQRTYHRGQPNQFTIRIPEHRRGNPALGIIEHDYKVTAPQEKA
jgi:hypothetical protein